MILVTGASGTVGSEVARQLLDAGQPVRILVRDARKVAALAGRVEVAVGDLDRPETLAPAMQGVDAVFLVTLQTGHDVNALATARKAGVGRIVKLSTGEATQAKVLIGKWAREREILIERSGIGWTFLRPDMFMSNSVEWWAETIRGQGAVYFPGGKGKAAPVDPADIAAVAVQVLTATGHEGCAYMLTGPQQLSIGEMVETIGRALGRPLQYTSIPPLAAGLWMLRSGMSLKLVAAIMQIMDTLRRGECSTVTDTVERVTGQPPRTFEAWCRAHIDAFEPAAHQ
jgi:uncharacterized protein YbjT (DUF2867 family)